MKTIDYNSDDPQKPTAVQAVLRIIFKLITLPIIFALTIPLWPFYLLGWIIWYRPPTTPYFSQFLRFSRLIWVSKPPKPGLSTITRCWLTLKIFQKMIMIPVIGLVWFMDELLYGRKLNKIEVKKPLFFISAARSGSTQMGLYLSEDEQFAAPTMIQSLTPFLWVWKLMERMPKDRIQAKFQQIMPPALLERHEGNPFQIDTFEGGFHNFHFNALSLHISPDVVKEEFAFGRYSPLNRRIWEKDFVKFMDRVARKTLLYVGPTKDGKPRRFLVKGHFLGGADLLAQKYPDARFLTIIRHPEPRLRSGINYMRVNPSDPMLGPIPWEWLSSALSHTEIEYCEIEQEWFTREDRTHRCVIRFTDFVSDLKNTMKKVYRECNGTDEVPSHIPSQHPPRDRKNYSVNRSLEELGIDSKEINNKLSSYIKWCEGAHKED